MDLCYSKEHLDTFVLLSGDSDFSPLVSKLKENNKYVIGVGREELVVEPPDRQLRRVHLLRGRLARQPSRAPSSTASTTRRREAFA